MPRASRYPLQTGFPQEDRVTLRSGLRQTSITGMSFPDGIYPVCTWTHFSPFSVLLEFHSGALQSGQTRMSSKILTDSHNRPPSLAREGGSRARPQAAFISSRAWAMTARYWLGLLFDDVETAFFDRLGVDQLGSHCDRTSSRLKEFARRLQVDAARGNQFNLAGEGALRALIYFAPRRCRRGTP